MTSMLVTGLGESPIPSDPTIYNRILDLMVRSSDANTLLTSIRNLLLKPTLVKSALNAENTEETVNNVWQALYQLTTGPTPYYASSAEMIARGLFEDSTLDMPLLSRLLHQSDISNQTLASFRDEMGPVTSQLDEIRLLIANSSTAAVLTKLDDIITVLTSMNAALQTRLDISMSTMNNHLQSLDQKLTALTPICETQLPRLTELVNVLTDTLYTVIPYADNTDTNYINCLQDKIPLIQLLLRALYLPQHTFTAPNRIDYQFIPYLSSTALVNNTGTGDGQYCPQVNKNDPYPAGDNYSAVVASDSVFSRMANPTILKQQQTVRRDTLSFKRR